MLFSLSFQKVMIVASDGVSDDDFGQQATHLHDRMLVKIAALTTRGFYRFGVQNLSANQFTILNLKGTTASDHTLRWGNLQSWTTRGTEHLALESAGIQPNI